MLKLPARVPRKTSCKRRMPRAVHYYRGCNGFFEVTQVHRGAHMLQHVPVLSSAVLHYLAPSPGDVVVDATVGAGGHARLIVERVGPAGKVLGLDQDEEMLNLAKQNLQSKPVTLQHGNF